MDFFQTYRVSIFIILFIIIISIVYWATPLGKNPKFLEYLGVISLIGGLLAIAAFVQQEAQAERILATATVNNTITQNQDTWISTERMLIMEPTLLRIYKQMYPNNIPLQEIPSEIDGGITAKEIHFTAILFQLIENILSPIAYGLTPVNTDDNRTWVRVFKSWFESEIVRNQWEYTKTFYTDLTQKLINQIILNYFAQQTGGCIRDELAILELGVKTENIIIGSKL